MATAQKRTPKTAEQLKQELEATKKKLADLEKRAYAEELKEAIKATSIVADYQKIKQKVPKVGEIAIFQAIAEAVNIKRLTITQAPPAKRNLTKTTETPKTS